MKDTISRLIEIRILVLTLGESHHSGWWKSQFMSPTGLSFLERLYPRSIFSAAVRSASRGAKFVHDTKVGKGEVFHLFRLSPEIERKLDLALEVQATNLMSHYQSLLADQNALLTTLEKLMDRTKVPLFSILVNVSGSMDYVFWDFTLKILVIAQP